MLSIKILILPPKASQAIRSCQLPKKREPADIIASLIEQNNNREAKQVTSKSSKGKSTAEDVDS